MDLKQKITVHRRLLNSLLLFPFIALKRVVHGHAQVLLPTLSYRICCKAAGFHTAPGPGMGFSPISHGWCHTSIEQKQREGISVTGGRRISTDDLLWYIEPFPTFTISFVSCSSPLYTVPETWPFSQHTSPARDKAWRKWIRQTSLNINVLLLVTGF